jgi:hypothetical protein
LFVIVAVLLALGPLEWSATRDVAGGQLSLETLHVAQAAADELALQFAQAANDPSTLAYRELRPPRWTGLLGTAGTNVSWRPSEDALREILRMGFSATVSLKKTLIGANPAKQFNLPLTLGSDPARRPVDLSMIVETARGAPETADVRARVTFRARVEGAAYGPTVSREAERVQGMRISRLGLPWPFDTIGLFIHHPCTAPGMPAGLGVLGNAPEQAKAIRNTLDNLRQLFIQTNFWSAMNGELRQKYERVRHEFEPPLYGFTWNDASYFLRASVGEIPDLRQWALPPRVKQPVQDFADGAASTQRALERLSANPNDAGAQQDLGNGVEKLLTSAAAFRNEREEYLNNGDRLKVDYAAPAHRDTFDPGIAMISSSGAWGQFMWYAMDTLDRFSGLFPQGDGVVRVRNGIVVIDAKPGGS